MSELNWTDEQKHKVEAAVEEAFKKANVALSFLPHCDPQLDSAETVRNELIDNSSTPGTLKLNTDHDGVNQRFHNVTVKVELSTEQVADKNLTNSLILFRRAANILAQETDLIVFSGISQAAPRAQNRYLVNAPKAGNPPAPVPVGGLVQAAAHSTAVVPQGGESVGNALVKKIVSDVQSLEGASNTGPFACVLGNTLYADAYDPNIGLVVPADRIVPLLNGPLLRSSGLLKKEGILVSLGANAVDVVIGTPPTVQYLQRTLEARYLFRVYLRFALRVRDTGANAPVTHFYL